MMHESYPVLDTLSKREEEEEREEEILRNSGHSKACDV